MRRKAVLARRNPLIVGQAPSSASDPASPLSGRSGRRIAELFGLELGSFLRRFRRFNLLDLYPGAKRKGDRFDLELARKRAFYLRAGGPDRFVLLGRNVVRAFELRDLRPLEVREDRGSSFFFLPHPSGVNLWWNDAGNVRRARRELRKFLKGKPSCR